MEISEHFTLSELTDSATATRKNISEQFTPSDAVIQNLKKLCINTLEDIRDLFKAPIIITSGYRCNRLNREIGSVAKSQHTEGKAADFRIYGYTIEEIYLRIKNSRIDYDQLIQEFDSWVHISYNSDKNRKQCFRASKNKSGKTQYLID